MKNNKTSNPKRYPIQDIVDDDVWQDLRKSLLGTWKLTPEQNIQKLRSYLGNFSDPLKKRRVRNYLTGSGFRSGKIQHPSICKLLNDVKL